MGVNGLWEILKPGAETVSLSRFALDAFNSDPNGHRALRIGIDISIWFHHTSVLDYQNAGGENAQLRVLFFRCARLLELPVLPLFVFDGPNRPAMKRGKKINAKDSWLVPGTQAMAEAFGFAWRYAPGEAEAELALLNSAGEIDAVLTDDVDAFLFGAYAIIRNKPNSYARADPDCVDVYSLKDLRDHSGIHLTQAQLILIALLSGGDYEKGVPGVGTAIAHALALCGFGESLLQAVQHLAEDDLSGFISSWRDDMKKELRTNSHGFLHQRFPKLADDLPDTFPDMSVVKAYITPVVSDITEVLPLEWNKEPDISKLASLCEKYFDWGYEEQVLKRFAELIWPGVLFRILRHRSLSDQTRVQFKNLPKFFASTALSQLISPLHKERKAATTNDIPALRFEFHHKLLSAFEAHTRAGLSGSRSAPLRNPHEHLDADDEAQKPSTGRSKKKESIRVWVPSELLRLAAPDMLDAYELMLKRKGSDASKSLPEVKALATKRARGKDSTPTSERAHAKRPRNLTPHGRAGGSSVVENGVPPAPPPASPMKTETVLVVTSDDDGDVFVEMTYTVPGAHRSVDGVIDLT